MGRHEEYVMQARQTRFMLSGSRFFAVVAAAVLLIAGCSSQHTRSLAMVRADGNAAFARGNYELAAADYEEYLERKPGAIDVRYRLGQTLMALGRPGEAEPHFRAVYDVNPLSIEYARAVAESMVASGRTGEGLAFMRRYLEAHPNADGYFALAELAQSAGIPDDAERALRVAARLDGGDSPEPHRRLARFYQAIGDDAAAVQRWRVVLFFDETDAEAHRALRALGQVPGPAFALSPSEVD